MKRRKYLRLLVSCICMTLVLSLYSCTKKEYNYYHTQTDIFKTTASIKYYYYKDMGEEIKSCLDSFDLSLNPFNSQSIIYKVNNNEEVIVDDWFISVFNKAQEVSELTEGIYDITSAPLINLWGFGFRNMGEVTPEKVDSLKEFVGYQRIHLKDRKVVKDDPRLQLNASSIAKGYSCDVIAALFERYGINDYMIEIGGEVKAKGRNPKGKYWAIAITTPIDDRSGTIKEIHEVVHLNDCSLATSGNYRNYYIKGGRKYSHTINPKTGYPSEENILSASVIYSNCMTADAFATAFMALGLDKAIAIADQIPDMGYLFVYIDADGSLKEVRSSNFNKYKLAE